MSEWTSYKTKLLSADIPDDVRIVANAIKDGQLAAFPTETVYGLGANALVPESVENIYRVKGRPSDNPLIIHLGAPDQISAYAKDINDIAKCLIDAFMPGPITLVLYKKFFIPDIVTGGLDTVGIRIPEQPAAKKLLQMCDFPVAAPSANLSGRPSGTTAEHVFQDFAGKIPYILDGGSCSVGIESTVVDVTGEYPVVLRPGMVTEKMIVDCCEKAGILIPKRKISDSIHQVQEKAPRAPGMKYRHYAPDVPVYIVYPQNGNRIHSLLMYLRKINGKGGVFCSESEQEKLCDLMEENVDIPIFYTYPDGFENEVRELFAAFRFLETKNLDYILVPGYKNVEDEREGAYMNRLKKAAMTSDSQGRFTENAKGIKKKKRSSFLTRHAEEDAKEKRVVFVCTGNTCRSPMAEAIFAEMVRGKHFVNEKKEPVIIRVQSAGTAASIRSTPNPNSIYAAETLFHLDIKEHISQQMDRILMKEADLLLCLGKSNKRQLQIAFPEMERKIFSFADPICGTKEQGISGDDIPDPYGSDQEVYLETARQIEKRLQALLPGILDFLQIQCEG